MSELRPCPFCGGEAVFLGPNVWNNCTATIKCKCGGSIAKSTSQMWVAPNNQYVATNEAIFAWNSRADVWIPVSERLPQESTAVLIYDDPIVSEALLIAGKWRYLTGAYVLVPVTHWIPLPQLPEGVGQR